MRTFLLIALLASTAMSFPAEAQDRGGDGRGNRAQQSDDRAESRSERRSERSSERRSDDDSSSSKSRPEPRPERPVVRERPQERSVVSSGSQRRVGNGNVAPAVSGQGAGDTVRNWRGRDRRPDSPTQIEQRNRGNAPSEAVVDRRSIEERNVRRPNDRNVRTTPGFGDRRLGRVGNNVPREGTAPPPITTEQARRGTESHRRWSGNWREDRRYDWRRYRDRNRSRFHLGFYFDPFGWSYRRYTIGWRLWPSYYGQDYWLNDPWQYRLPPAYGPYRWVRYYDDALLVNIYTGTVVDVLHNFFW